MVLGTALCPDQMELELSQCQTFENPMVGTTVKESAYMPRSNEKCNILPLSLFHVCFEEDLFIGRLLSALAPGSSLCFLLLGRTGLLEKR